MSSAPIFIVGVQRSGTTLLAAMLAAHSRLSCGPETHFFRRLAELDASRLCDSDAWPQSAVDFVRSISHTGFVESERTTLLEKYRVDVSSVADCLRGGEPSIARVLASVTEPYMAARGKKRWVEKTPDHLLHAATIRQHFPASPIIRIVRDPRDVVLSLLRVPWGVKSVIEGLLYWERMDRQSRAFFAHDHRSVTVRFEDLIENPARTLQAICDAIGEIFEPGMLDTSRTGVEINTRGVPWKDKVSQAPDASRVAAWRNGLAPSDNRLAEAILGDRILAFGYRQQETFTRLAVFRPAGQLSAKYQGPLSLLASEGVRFWPKSADEAPDLKVYLGNPGSREWKTPAPEEGRHPIRTTRLLADLMGAGLRRKSVYWISSADDQWMGYRSYVLRKALAPFRLSTGEHAPAVTHP